MGAGDTKITQARTTYLMEVLVVSITQEGNPTHLFKEVLVGSLGINQFLKLSQEYLTIRDEDIEET